MLSCQLHSPPPGLRRRSLVQIDELRRRLIMPIRNIPFSHSCQPAEEPLKNYDESLRRAERQTALAREMITTARRASNSAVEMRERAAPTHSAFRKMCDISGQPAPPTSSDRVSILNSWKEIARYMGRGVRTVQRYESDLHLPVRRLPGKGSRTVFAMPQDLDAWLQCCNDR